MIKNIIFDLGGVVLKGEPIDLLDSLSLKSLEYNKLRLFFENWEKLDLGEISLLDKYNECNFSRDIDYKYKDILLNHFEKRDVNLELLKLINILKNKGYKIFVLSDNIKELEAYFINNALFKSFDEWIVSCDYHATKKDGTLFNLLFDKYELNPKECYFVDNNPRNIEVAKSFGLNAYLFNENDDIEKIYDDLNRYDIIQLERWDCMTLEELYEILMGDEPSTRLIENEEGLFKLIPELKVCKGFNQNNKWHVYDVYEHTLHVVDYVPNDLILRLAALFHDIGKTMVYQEDENNVGHFYDHWKASQIIFDKFANQHGVDDETKNSVSNLIYYHDINLSEFDNDSLGYIYSLLKEDGVKKLYQLKRADLLAQNPKYHNVLDEYDKEEGRILSRYKGE